MATVSEGRVCVRRMIAAALLVGTLAAALVVVNVATTSPSEDADFVPFVGLYEPPRTSLQRLLNQGDGQAFAAIASDPLLRNREVFRVRPAEAAYRAQRPVLAYAAWLVALGQRGLVPAALFATMVVAVAASAAAATAIAHEWKVPWRPAVLAAVGPASLLALDAVGPEPLGLALVLAGCGMWWRRRPGVVAIALFSLAGLTRETFLLVPAGLAVHEVLERRPRRALLLAASLIPYLGWSLLVRTWLGHWPFDGDGRIGLVGAGVLNAAGEWSADDIAAVLLLALVSVLSIARGQHRGVRAILAIHVMFALVMGPEVWQRWEFFVRPLAGLYTFGILALLATRHDAIAEAGAVDALQDRPVVYGASTMASGAGKRPS